MTPRFPRTIWLGLVLLVAPALLVLGLQSYLVSRTTPELNQGRAWLVHTFESITTVRALERAVQEAERGQRGYLVTGDEAYLEPYHNALDEIPALFAKLEQLTSDNGEQQGEQQRRLTNLERQIAIKLASLKSTLEAREHEGFDASRRMLLTHGGLDAMRRIHGLIDATVAAEDALLTERLAHVEAAEHRSVGATVVGGGLTLAITMLGVITLLFALRDIRRSEAASHASDQRFRLFVESVTGYAIFLLDPEGLITSWNASAECNKCCTAGEFIGEHFSRFYTEEDREAGLPQRALEAAKREGKYEAEEWRVRKDGSRFWASVVLTRVLDRQGQLVGFAKITRDVSERVSQQQALEQAREELAQSQKMEALGQLSGGIAHDFNNLLHVIGNAVDGVRRRLGTGKPEVTRLLDMARRNADRGAALTQRILAFSRRQPLDPRPIAPNKLVAGMAELLRQTLGESVVIETVLGGGLWAISADPNQLETSLLNLAVNARDAMPGGGKLTIETANVLLDEAYAAANKEVKAGQYVMFALSDTGTGMTKEAVARAFEPFFTTKEIGHGTGLGLSQVYGFIKQSGGHVAIYSEPGEGTTVKLYLPRLAEGEAAQAAKEARPLQSGSAGEAILVVEDDEDVRAFTAESLRELGYRVLTARDAKSALEALETEPGVDLLFTDVGLPGGVNGRQLADAARQRWPALKVLFTTAYARNAIVHHGRLDRGVALIVKPFTQTDLASKVRCVLEDGEGTALGKA